MHKRIIHTLAGATALTVLSLGVATPSFAASTMCADAAMKSDDMMADDDMMKDDMADEEMMEGDDMAGDDMMSDDAMEKDDMMSDDAMMEDDMAKDDMKSDDMMMADYTVKAGDSLWSIAAETLCDGDKYHMIVEANMDKLGDGMMIHPGQVLHIPGD